MRPSAHRAQPPCSRYYQYLLYALDVVDTLGCSSFDMVRPSVTGNSSGMRSYLYIRLILAVTFIFISFSCTVNPGLPVLNLSLDILHAGISAMWWPLGPSWWRCDLDNFPRSPALRLPWYYLVALSRTLLPSLLCYVSASILRWIYSVIRGGTCSAPWQTQAPIAVLRSCQPHLLSLPASQLDPFIILPGADLWLSSGPLLLLPL